MGEAQVFVFQKGLQPRARECTSINMPICTSQKAVPTNLSRYRAVEKSLIKP